MSQQVFSRKPWVLISVLKENTAEQQIENLRPKINDLVDSWQEIGRIMWSGALSDNKTGIAIFEATDDEATAIHSKYGQICDGVLDHYMYQWEAMPILSFLEK
jgi:hypothetical protein